MRHVAGAPAGAKAKMAVDRRAYQARLLTPIEGHTPVHASPQPGIIYTVCILTYLEFTEPLQ